MTLCRPHNPTQPEYRAFTLLEMMIVIVILGFVANLAVPMLGSTKTQQLISAAELLEADLAFARVESITHADDPRVFVIDQANDRYYIATASDTDTPITDPITKQPYSVRFGQGRGAELGGVTIQSYELDGDDELQFGQFGQLDQATEATITIAADDRTITITLDPTSGQTSIGPLN